MIRKAQEPGGETCAVICFDAGLQARVTQHLGQNGVQVERLGGKRARSSRAVVVTDAKHAKGQQFDTCVLVGVGRDQVPDYAGAKTELQRATRKEDALREFIVAMSRAKRGLHFVWVGAEGSEFVRAMGRRWK